MLKGSRRCLGCALVSETAQVELRSGQVYTPARVLPRGFKHHFLVVGGGGDWRHLGLATSQGQSEKI